MAKDRNGALPDEREYTEKTENYEEEENGVPPRRKSGIARENSGSESEEDRKGSSKSRRRARESSDSEGEEESGRKRGKSERRKRKSRGRYSSEEDSGSDSEESDSDSGSEGSGLDSESESERRSRRKRKEKKRRREREEDEDDKERKRRRREKEKKRRRREREEERKKKEKRKKKKKEKKERGKKGAVTNLWGKYGIIRETDMWTKRPEFTAWLAEVKEVNLETLPNWEEKQMFKQFMEDHNTATFPSKKYYNLDNYHMRKMEKEMEKGFKKVMGKERTVFNDEEQRRQELLREREKHKEEQVETLKLSMQSGMAQAMKEQAQLREEMAYQYKLGNFEAAAAIQRRLDPDVAM